MQTLTSLRAHITAAVPELAVSPEKLAIYAQKGRIVAAGAASLSFEYAFTAEIIITDFAASPDAVMVPLLAWVRANQPHIADSPQLRDTAIRFTAELLNSETCDISIEVDVTEPTLVQRRPAAVPGPDPTTTAERWLVTHPAPPERLGEPSIPALVEVVNGEDEVLATWAIPAARN